MKYVFEVARVYFVDTSDHSPYALEGYICQSIADRFHVAESPTYVMPYIWRNYRKNWAWAPL